MLMRRRTMEIVQRFGNIGFICKSVDCAEELGLGPHSLGFFPWRITCRDVMKTENAKRMLIEVSPNGLLTEN